MKKLQFFTKKQLVSVGAWKLIQAAKRLDIKHPVFEYGYHKYKLSVAGSKGALVIDCDC